MLVVLVQASHWFLHGGKVFSSSRLRYLNNKKIVNLAQFSFLSVNLVSLYILYPLYNVDSLTETCFCFLDSSTSLCVWSLDKNQLHYLIVNSEYLSLKLIKINFHM